MQALRDVIIPAGIRLDVVAATGLDPGALDDLAIESGGLSPVLPKPVGEMDAVTQAIRDRYHVAGTVDGPGAHDVTLNVGGQTFTSPVDVPARRPTPARAAAATTAVTPTTVGAAVTDAHADADHGRRGRGADGQPTTTNVAGTDHRDAVDGRRRRHRA